MSSQLENSASAIEATLPAGVSRGNRKFAAIVTLACAFVGATIGFNSFNSYVSGIENIVHEERIVPSVADPSATNKQRMSGMERLLQSELEPEDLRSRKEEELLVKITEKMQPVPIRFYGENGEPEKEVEEATATKKSGDKRGEHQKRSMVPHQFLHLHHMKTGGTSIDRLLRCSMDRLKKEANYDVPYFSIHECSKTRFEKCVSDKEHMCRAFMKKASVMSYCAALKYLDEFGWWRNNNEENKVKAVTVLRHPVDRVWSMFRFQTKNCYKCRPLKEIYEQLDAGEDTGLDKLCLDQIQNHEVNNLLSTDWPLEVTKLDAENNREHAELSTNMIQEAIDNMKNFFTVIGITEDLPGTASIIGTVFPWMNLDGSEEHGTTSQCKLPHANGSPSNNRCGEKNTHWDLPKNPDQETIDLIIKHNSMDMELYEAAVSYFELQKKVLGMTDENEG